MKGKTNQDLVNYSIELKKGLLEANSDKRAIKNYLDKVNAQLTEEQGSK